MTNLGHITSSLWKYSFLNTFINQSISMLGNLQYYIDRCELWGIIREINSGIFTWTFLEPLWLTLNI
jgi:hypothetical protein